MAIQLDLLPHQADFIADTKTRNIALIGGYGSGKTKALAIKLIVLAMMNAGHEGIVLSPTYQMAIKNVIPTIENELMAMGFVMAPSTTKQLMKRQFNFNKSELMFKINIDNKITKIHTLAAEHYKRAAGLNAAFFGIDEADLLDVDTFQAAWQMMSSRLRKGNVFQGCAVSTPEGFKGCYKHWVEEVSQRPELAKDRRMVKASTYDNPFLPPEYIRDLEDQYPEHLIKAYLMGEFVNLAGKPVYWRFDKDINSTTKTILDYPRHVIHIGQDFNKNVNAGVIHVIDGGKSYAIDEIYGANDTQELANEIKKRFPWQYSNNAIRFYPDASGFEGIQNLKRNFPEWGPEGRPNFRYSGSNPRIDKRVAAVNTKFGQPESFVNAQTCPWLFKGLTQQTYDKNGEPDKHSGLDHALDGHGYFVHKTWPLTGNVSAVVN